MGCRRRIRGDETVKYIVIRGYDVGKERAWNE